MRTPIIAGNWKMHKTIKDAVGFVEQIKDQVQGTDVEVLICAPYTLLQSLEEATKGTNIKIGAQNMHWEEKGAFTGEISPIMLKDIGIQYCIIGHSERRQYFCETDETVNKKVHTAIKHGIVPVICVGETLPQREDNQTQKVVHTQVSKALENVEEGYIKDMIIAYEPIWAIGTGKTATPKEANEVIYTIRETIKSLYGEEISESVRIQYGGSVKPSNVEEIMNQSDIDGALVGGASLNAKDFVELVNF